MFNETIVIVGIAVVVLFLIVIGILSIWRKVPQDKALVVTGAKKRVITGGGGLVIPFLERADLISLENMKIEVSINDSLSSTGVPLNVNGIVIVKIRAELDDILRAMEQFNRGDVEETITGIKETVREVMEGQLRAIVSTMNVDELYKNRETFATNVQAVAAGDLKAMGLEIITFTIRDISDRNGYLASLGVKQTEEVKRQASVAKAEAEKETAIRVAMARQEAKEKEIQVSVAIAEAEKEKDLKISAYRKEQETARAKADVAYQIEENIRSKEVIEAKLNADILKKEKEIELAHQETLRQAEQLKAEIEKKAEAEKYRTIQEAEAQKARQIAEAEAEAETLRLKAESEAKAIRLRGEAEAEAIRLKGEAEAEAMQKRAEAYKEYGEAAILELLVEKLPEIASAIAQPLSQTEKIVIMDQGSSDGSGGAAKIPGYVNHIAGMVPEIVETLTGKNVMDMVETFMTKTDSVNLNIHNSSESTEVVEGEIVD